MKLHLGIASCADYKGMIQDVVDNESSRAQELYLKRHLKMCLKCLNKLNLEKELKKAVQHKLQYKKVPDGLADSIRKELSKSA